MKNLLKHEKKQKVVVTNETTVSQEALNEVAMELIKGNHKTLEWQVDRSFLETETTVELLVGDGYFVTIKNGRIG